VEVRRLRAAVCEPQPIALLRASHAARASARAHAGSAGDLSRFCKIGKTLRPLRNPAGKTRIAFQMRMSFAALSFRRDELNGHVVLARRLENPRFTRVETISPRNHVHNFKLRSPDELDAELLAWLREAYRVGKQLHLKD
jgi:uncharacterized protein DUF5655